MVISLIKWISSIFKEPPLPVPTGASGETAAYQWRNYGGDSFRWRTYRTRFPTASVVHRIYSLTGIEMITDLKPYEITIWVAPLFSWSEMEHEVHAILASATTPAPSIVNKHKTGRLIHHAERLQCCSLNHVAKDRLVRGRIRRDVTPTTKQNSYWNMCILNLSGRSIHYGSMPHFCIHTCAILCTRPDTVLSNTVKDHPVVTFLRYVGGDLRRSCS